MVARAKAETPTAARDLGAELEASRRQLAAAQAAAEAIASEEDAALDEGDDAFARFERRRKLAARDVIRLAKVVSDLEVAIDDELAARELAAFAARYADVLARNMALRDRLVQFREEVLPTILALIRDLAIDEIEVNEINRLVPHASTLWTADAAVRARPSQQEEIISDEVVELWCDRDGRPMPVQEAVAVDANGIGTMSADFGTRRVECFRRKFRRVEKLSFRPASDAPFLWKSIVLPRFDRLDAPTYDGRYVYSPQNALQVLGRGRREHPRDSSIEMIPLDNNGQPIARNDTGPAIPK